MKLECTTAFTKAKLRYVAFETHEKNQKRNELC